MSKKSFKSQASSSKAAFGSSSATLGSVPFGRTSASTLSYVYEPPDLGQIADATIVVALKNLQKKDGTTKAKALEELQTYVSSLGEDRDALEDALLDAWARLFPRLSVDNARRVRQLAYSLHGSTVALCGKRFLKHMPSTIGAWLAGLHDGDRPVARSAQESFRKTFPTEEKQRGVWKAFQEPILVYCSDTILRETPNTLSDERTVSTDDAEAKYSRAVGGALVTVASALENLAEDDLQRRENEYKELLHADNVWNLASSKDPSLRRGVYRLLLHAEAKRKHLVDSQVAGNHLVKALDAEQLGSMTDFLRCLTSLSKAQPEIWTSLYTGSSKKPPSKRLCHFLSKGSQGASGDVWKYFEALLFSIPQSVLMSEVPKSEEKSATIYGLPVLVALKDGVARKNEAKSQQTDGWFCYLSLAKSILDYNSDQGARNELVRDQVLPIAQQYVKPDADRVEWSSNGSEVQRLYEKAVTMAYSYAPEVLKQIIQSLSSSLVEDMQTSLPEQSKDFARSQDFITNEFTRWYNLRTSLSRSDDRGLVLLLEESVEPELEVAMHTLESRGGKPYSAAAVLEQVARYASLPQHVAKRDVNSEASASSTRAKLLTFVEKRLPSFMGSPSSISLLRLLAYFEPIEQVHNSWTASIANLIAAEASPNRTAALQYVVSLNPWPDPGECQAALSEAVLAELQKSLKGDTEAWLLVEASVQNPQAPESLKEDILIQMTHGLSIHAETDQAIEGFEKIAKNDRRTFQKLTSSSPGSELLSKLLYLSQEGDEEVQGRASWLKDVASEAIVKDNDDRVVSNPVLKIIRKGISNTNAEALSVESLVSQALELTKSAPQDRARDILSEILPDEEQWNDALNPFIHQAVDGSLALSNPLGGTVYLLASPETAPKATEQHYDTEGRSAPFRLALFVANFGKATELLQIASDGGLIATFRYVSVLAQLAGDHLSLSPPLPLFDRSGDVDKQQIVNSVADIQLFCATWVRNGAITSDRWLNTALGELYDAAGGSSPKSYYCARAYAAAVSWVGESKDNIEKLRRTESEITRISKQPQLLSDFALLGGASDSVALARLAALKKLFNELVVDLSAWDFESDAAEGLRKIVMLNLILQIEDFPIETIPKQRIVFFVQHISTSLQKSGNSAFASELLKALAVLLSSISDIYGEFWNTIINVVANALESEQSSLPLVHVCLRLCSVVSKMATEESNEDLQESWNEAKSRIADGLLVILRAHAESSDSFNQPLKTVNSLLARQVSTFADSINLDLEDLYPIMASESTTLQHSAYDILHKAIPAAQEQVAIDAALSKDYVATLPEELLSLILEAPSAEDYLDLYNEPEMPSALARYLLSWKLLYDHWTSASYKVQSNYVSSLKDSHSLPLLLSFTFDVLMGLRGKNSIDPSRLPSIESYSSASSYSDPSAETHALLCHLYYLTLLHAPHLAKDWFTNACPRALKSRIETWTEKHFSPLVIAAELATVSAWTPPASTVTDSAASSDVEINVHPNIREATVSLPIDEIFLGIRILLPPAYPLAPVALSTLQRVGIDERKWTSFLNVSRIVINFSSTSQGLGCIIDGIAAWRSNVLSALRGQSECAICYSVVSENLKVPDKRCATCNNRFHGVCLWKWFQRSGGSSCPLCRNAFNYA